MDENVKDVLLVVFGGSVSLLGTTIANWFQFRREHLSRQHARKTERAKEIIDYLRGLSRISAQIQDFLIKQHTTINYSADKFIENINIQLVKLNDSPLNGLPPMLMSNNQKIIKLLGDMFNYQITIHSFIALVGQHRSGSFTQEQVIKYRDEFAEMNKKISEIISELEKDF